MVAQVSSIVQRVNNFVSLMILNCLYKIQISHFSLGYEKCALLLVYATIN